MTRIYQTIAALALGALAFVPQASAAPNCGAHQVLSQTLTQKYKENRQGIGLAGQSQVIELYVSPEGTWTLLASDIQGRTCIIAAGEAWQAEPKVLAGLDS